MCGICNASQFIGKTQAAVTGMIYNRTCSKIYNGTGMIQNTAVTYNILDRRGT